MPVATDVQSTQSPVLPLRWLDSYGDHLYAYALRRVRRPEIAEDLVQDTLLAGMRGFEHFSHRSDVKNWLTGILRNKIADHLRARYRQEKIETCSLDDESMFDARGRWKIPVQRWTGDPHRLAELTELRATLSSCMAKLPTRMAHLFLSRATDQTITSELCNELEITPDNAWMLLHRARSRLRQCMTTNWFTDTKPRRK